MDSKKVITTAVLALSLTPFLAGCGVTKTGNEDGNVPAPLSLAEPDTVESAVSPNTPQKPVSDSKASEPDAAAADGRRGGDDAGKITPAAPPDVMTGLTPTPMTPYSPLVAQDGNFDITIPSDLPTAVSPQKLRSEVTKQLKSWGVSGITSCEPVTVERASSPDSSTSWSGTSRSWAWTIKTDVSRIITVRADWIGNSDGTDGYLSVYAVN